MSLKHENDTQAATYKSWGWCSECGYQGTLDFAHLDSESYDDVEAVGFLMNCQCPACGVNDHVLISSEEYYEITGRDPGLE